MKNNIGNNFNFQEQNYKIIAENEFNSQEYENTLKKETKK